jgi:ABC-type multidrug transport system ATPase subunit
MSADDGADPLVRVEGVSRSFGDLSVLEDVSFDVPGGSVTSVVGPNGSGKSTLLRIVAGLLAPDEGTVDIGAEATRPVGYLAQRPDYRAPFTCRETIEFYGSLLGPDVDVDPDAVLAAVGLGPVADRPVGALSGGMVRLLGIAQATVGDPPVLVFDEPSSGLDPTMTRTVREAIDELAAGGRSILVATHDLGTVERVADRVLVLDRGGIVASGSVADLVADVGVEDFEAAIPELTRPADEVAVSAGRQEAGEE